MMKRHGGRSIVLFVLVLVLGLIVQPNSAAAAGGSSDQAVAYQIDVAHDGRLAADALTPPLVMEWSRADLGGTVSYPLIAGGKVFVTVGAPPSSNSYPAKWLYALDENTGATIW